MVMRKDLPKYWRLYCEIVHQTLFLTIVAHEAPWILVIVLHATTTLVEEHGPMVMIILVTSFGIVSRILEARLPAKAIKPPAERPKILPRRDERGRFVACGKKRGKRTRRKADKPVRSE
jgi:hypothetical protein